MNELHIGVVISYLRRNQHMTQEQLAQGICSRRYIIALEQGKNFPTSYILNLLSEKLKTNIFSYYLIVGKHKDFKTHSQIECMHRMIESHQYDALRRYITTCVTLTTFQEDEPLQVLYYAKALCSSCLDHEYTLAIDYALSGLKVHYPDFTIGEFKKGNYSNIELSLVDSIAADLYQSGCTEEGKLLFKDLLTYLKDFTTFQAYSSLDSHEFKSNLYFSIVYQMISFCIHQHEFSNLLPLIDETLTICKQLNYSTMLYGLVKNRFIICYHLGDIPSACKYYQDALVLCQYSKSTDTAENLKVLVAKEYPKIESLLPIPHSALKE